MAAAPPAERMPWPGYEPDRPGASLLPWAWAEERLRESRRYWLATGGPDGSPHLAPVWAVWVDGALVFSTGRLTRKARNLALRPACTISTENAAEAVVVHGLADEIGPGPRLDAVGAAYAAKYGGSPEIGDSPVIAVRPLLAWAVVDGDPTVLPTRWRLTPG